jgi:hypothetical protein
MLRDAVARSPDIRRLWEEGYELRLTPGNHLVVDRIPYVAADKSVKQGRLVMKVEFTAEDVAFNAAADHTAYFIGEAPCDENGQRLIKVINSEASFELETGLTAQFRFSSKPPEGTGYPDYHRKVTDYVGLLLGHAIALEPTITATPGRVVLEDEADNSPFVYRDNASTRAGIVAITDRLRALKIAIVGVGGTGSYILDLVAKTPVRAIHLFDGDDFLPHNAFRGPGAATSQELTERPTKVAYWASRYSAMKRHVIPHPYPIDDAHVAELREMDFVFLSAEGGAVKRLVVAKLEEFGTLFIDVGLSVDKNGGALGGMVCVTTSTRGQRAAALARIDFSQPRLDDNYDDNIQIADLNALNATLAVIKWKKLFGFYRDSRHEFFAAYTLERNHVVNESV